MRLKKYVKQSVSDVNLMVEKNKTTSNSIFLAYRRNSYYFNLKQSLGIFAFPMLE